MTTNTELLNELAGQIVQDTTASLQWIIRGELATDEAETDKSLIAVMHTVSQDEVVAGNMTMRLQCALTGQAAIGTASINTLRADVEKLYNTVLVWLTTFKYTEVLDTVVIEGLPSGNIETATEGLYYTFTIPFQLVVQF